MTAGRSTTAPERSHVPERPHLPGSDQLPRIGELPPAWPLAKSSNATPAGWPVVHTLDFRAAVDVPFGRFRPEFTVDVLNLMNLFDRSQGQVLYVPFNDITVSTVTEAGGMYTYRLNAAALPGANRFSRDDLRSRWQAQLGLRLRF